MTRRTLLLGMIDVNVFFARNAQLVNSAGQAWIKRSIIGPGAIFIGPTALKFYRSEHVLP